MNLVHVDLLAFVRQFLTEDVDLLSAALVIACVIITILLIVIAILVWRLASTADDRPHAASNAKPVQTQEMGFMSSNSSPGDNEIAELKSRNLSSAETVENRSDDDVLEELRPGHNSERTVDATGDISISNDSDEDTDLS